MNMATVELMMPLKDRLRELRTAACLTQQELAVKAGLSISSVVQIERGTIPDPRVSTAKALARGLGVPVDELLADDGGDQAAAGEGTKGKPRRKGKGK